MTAAVRGLRARRAATDLRGFVDGNGNRRRSPQGHAMEAIAREHRARTSAARADPKRAAGLSAPQRLRALAPAVQRRSSSDRPRSELATMVRFIAETAAAFDMQSGSSATWAWQSANDF